MYKLSPEENEVFYITPLVENGYVRTDKIHLLDGHYKVDHIKNIFSISYKKVEYIIFTDISTEKTFTKIYIKDNLPQFENGFDVYAILTTRKTLRDFKLNEILNE